jgi:hypothetical protein
LCDVVPLFREAAARARDFLIEPAAEGLPQARGSRSRIEIAVLGLSTGCGVTTVARGLALALRAPGGPPSLVLMPHDSVADVEVRSGALALVWDAGTSDAPLVRGVARCSDALVLVAGKGTEPAMAEIASDLLRTDAGRVVLVANRVTDPSRWSGRCDVSVPESWLGAALLRRGRLPPGALGAAMVQLAATVRNG